MKRTEHYDLPTWEMSDRVLMSDFNDMTGKIDAALQGHAEKLAKMPQIAWGSYTGDGGNSNPYQRTLTVGFEPRYLVITPRGGPYFALTAIYPMTSTQVHSASQNVSATVVDITWSRTGASLKFNSNSPQYCLNESGVKYYYFAIG